MEKEKEIHSCVDCGTQNCKYKDRTYPDFCLTTNLKEEDRQWALERYDEGNNRQVMIASAEVEYEGYCQWTRVLSAILLELGFVQIDKRRAKVNESLHYIWYKEGKGLTSEIVKAKVRNFFDKDEAPF
jgi:hypothetical protein